MPTRRHESAGRVLLLAGAVLFAGVAAETALRLHQAWALRRAGGVAAIHRASDDPRLVYELTPGASASRDGVEIRINSDGFRDDPFPRTRQPGELRVVVMGDSVAAGHGVAMHEAFPQRLERQLAEAPAAGARPVTVFNLGVYGYATSQQLRLLESRGLGYRPDLVIVAYHLNDPDVADAGQSRYFRRPASHLFAELRAAFRHWRQRDDTREYHRRIHEDRAAEVEADFGHLGELSRQSSVPILVAVLPLFRWDERYAWEDLHRQVGALARRNGLAFLDLAPPLVAEPVGRVGLNIWHPNARGHEIVAEALADWIRQDGGSAGR